MGSGSKKLYWAGAGVAFLLVLLLGLAVIVPGIVDSAWLKETIQAEVAKQVGGDFNFQKPTLIILPRPAVSLQQVSLTMPGMAQVKLENLKVYPKMLPLLVGKIALAKVVAEAPDFSLQLPEKFAKPTDGSKPFSISEALVSTSTELLPVLSAIPGLKVGVRKGSLRLLAKDTQLFLFENITGTFNVSSKSLTAAISCDSNIWESMQLRVTLLPGTREGKGAIALKNLKAKDLADYFLKETLTRLVEAVTSLETDFAFNPETGLTADLESPGSSLAVLHGNKKIAATIKNLKGSIQLSDERSLITVDDLTFTYPQVKLSGSLKLDRAVPLANLDISATDGDIAALREAIPVFIAAFQDDLPVIQDIFDIVRGGHITKAVFHAEGKAPAELAEFAAMTIQGHLADAEISLADLGLDLQEVSGDVNIANTILEGKNLSAKTGNTTGSGGTLKLGLAQKKTTPFHLDLDLDADLSQVQPLLKRVVSDKKAIEHLELFENVKGTGQGRLTLGESLESLSVRVEISNILAQGNYKPIPYPISIDSGRFLVDGLQIESFNLQGKIGRSTFTNYSSRISFEGEPSLEADSGAFHVLLDEIYPWLRAQKKLADDLRDIKNITGLAEITVKSIKGPLLQPANQQYDLECGLQNVTLTSDLLPGPLNIKTGKANILPDKIVFEDLQAELSDSSLAYSGVLQNFLSGKTNAEIIVTKASIGQEFNSWLMQKISIPPRYTFRAPLLISRLTAKWSRDELFEMQGDFSIPKGPIFSIDVIHNPNELHLRNLAIQNNEDRATIKLDLGKRKIGAEFQGSLSMQTVDVILLHNDAFPDAWLKGGMKLQLDKDSPAESVAGGNLTGGNLSIPWPPDKTLRFDSFSLSAVDRILTVNSAEAVFEDRKYALKGQASLSQELLSIGFEINADTVELDKILSGLQANEAEKVAEETEEGKLWDKAVAAQINLQADSLHYKNYIWKPFRSQITYENSLLDIAITDAELCNISSPGKISLHDGQISLDFTLEAQDQEFNEVLSCLEGGDKRMTGILNLKGNFSGQGTRDTLLDSLEGNLQYEAKDGYIYEDAYLAKLLYLLDVTNLFKGKIPDLSTKGFHYDTFVVKGVMDKGILTIAPAKLEAPIMGMVGHGTIDIPREKVNIQVFVAPLQTVNTLQKMLPIVRTVIPRNLVGVPAEVSGDFSDIKVKVLSMSAISKNVFGILVDALSTPIRLLEREPEEAE